MSSKPKVEKKETSGTEARTESSNQAITGGTRPLAETAPLFSNIWNTGAGAAVAPPTNWVAGANPTQMDAISQMLAAAPGLGANATSLRDMAGKVAGGFFLDPSNDPTFAGAANAAINPITRQLTEKVLPGIIDTSIRNSGAGIGPGAYGGPRQDIQQNQVIQDWTQTAGDITAKMANASRQAGLDLIPKAGIIDQAATSAALLPGQVTGAAGTQLQGFDQLGLDNVIKQWMASLTGAQQGANILTTGGFGNRSQNTTGSSNMDINKTGLEIETGAAPSVATQWLQGLTGGAGMLSSLFGLPGVGSIFGGLGSLFGGGNPNMANAGYDQYGNYFAR